MNEKIPNYYLDCFLAYSSFKKRSKKTFEEFYKEKKDLIYVDGMRDPEICKALDISSQELKRTLDSAYKKIRLYERRMGLELFDKDVRGERYVYP